MSILSEDYPVKQPEKRSSGQFMVFVWSGIFLVGTVVVAWGIYFAVQHWPFGKKTPMLQSDAWNASQLPLVTAEYKAEPVSKDLKVGPAANVNGLSVQWLDFRLPLRHLHAWSPDGRAIFAVEGNSVVRIDAANWRITHRIDLSTPPADIKGLALTSEGVVVALRWIEQSNVPVPINLRTGERVALGSYHSLVVLAPADLQVVRQFLGPSYNLAGAPKSPIVCVSDDNVRAKLVDLRSGKVLHEAGLRMNEPASPAVAAISGFDELLMSPDGRTLYHRGHGGGPVSRADISTGKFVAMKPLEASDVPADAQDEHATMYVSPDSRYVAIAVGDDYLGEDRGYSIVDVTSESGADFEAPLPAPHTTSFAFVGRNNRPVANCGVLHKDDSFRMDDFDLALPQRGQPGTRFQIDGKSELKDSRLSGSPVSDFVFVNTGQSKTAWVKLPPNTGEQKLGLKVEAPKAEIRGFVSQERLEFADKPPREDWGVGEILEVEMPADAWIACSSDGSRFYVADLSGRITAFDTDSLREVRRVELGDKALANLDIGDMQVTKAGLLIHVGDHKHMLFDGETLDAKHSIDLKESQLDSASPNSNWLCTINQLHELEIFDVRDGKSIARVTPRQMEHFETYEGKSSSRSTYIRGASIGDDDATLTFRYGAWHVFSLNDEKLEHVSLMVPPTDGGNAAFSRAYPVSKRGLAFFVGETFDVYEYPKLVRSTRMGKVHEQPWCEILGVARSGVIYLRDPESKRITAYDVDGKAVCAGDGTSDRLDAYSFLPLPNRPERVFARSSQRVYAIDLKPIE